MISFDSFRRNKKQAKILTEGHSSKRPSTKMTCQHRTISKHKHAMIVEYILDKILHFITSKLYILVTAFNYIFPSSPVSRLTTNKQFSVKSPRHSSPVVQPHIPQNHCVDLRVKAKFMLVFLLHTL